MAGREVPALRKLVASRFVKEEATTAVWSFPVCPSWMWWIWDPVPEGRKEAREEGTILLSFPAPVVHLRPKFPAKEGRYLV